MASTIRQGHGIYNPSGAVVGHQGHGIYNPTGAVVGQHSHGIYNPNGAVVGQQGHGIYNPNAGTPGQNGGGIYNQFGAQNQFSCPLEGQYLRGYAAGDRQDRNQVQTQQRCQELGVACAGITCRSPSRCTVRGHQDPVTSPSGEYSLLKGEPHRGCAPGQTNNQYQAFGQNGGGIYNQFGAQNQFSCPLEGQYLRGYAA